MTDLTYETNRLISIVRGFNAPLAQQLTDAVQAERNAAYYRIRDATLAETREAALLAHWRKTEHVFEGRHDRWCERCNLPDRHSIHVTPVFGT